MWGDTRLARVACQQVNCRGGPITFATRSPPFHHMWWSFWASRVMEPSLGTQNFREGWIVRLTTPYYSTGCCLRFVLEMVALCRVSHGNRTGHLPMQVTRISSIWQGSLGVDSEPFGGRDWAARSPDLNPLDYGTGWLFSIEICHTVPHFSSTLISPVCYPYFCRSFYKNEIVWRISHTVTHL